MKAFSSMLSLRSYAGLALTLFLCALCPFLFHAPAQAKGHESAIVVDLGKNQLHYDGKTFPVATGKHHKTPVGNFAILAKKTCHAYDQDGKYIAGCAKNNPYGPHFMLISNSGIAIHGTNNPKFVSQQARVSHGCIRMTNAASNYLYHHAAVGTPVRIVSHWAGTEAKVDRKQQHKMHGRSHHAMGEVKINVDRARLHTNAALSSKVVKVLEHNVRLELVSSQKHHHFYQVRIEGSSRTLFIHDSVVEKINA